MNKSVSVFRGKKGKQKKSVSGCYSRPDKKCWMFGTWCWKWRRKVSAEIHLGGRMGRFHGRFEIESKAVGNIRDEKMLLQDKDCRTANN